MDLLNKLGNKPSDASADGTASAAPNQQNSSPADMSRGDDMLNKVGTQAQDSGNVAATPAVQTSADDSLGNAPSSNDDVTEGKTVNDP